MPYSKSYPTIKFERSGTLDFASVEALTLNVLENPIKLDVSEVMRFASGYLMSRSRRTFAIKFFPFYTTNILTKQNSADLEAAIEFFTKPRKVFRIAQCSLIRYSAAGTVNSLLNIAMSFKGIDTALDDERGWEEVTVSFEANSIFT